MARSIGLRESIPLVVWRSSPKGTSLSPSAIRPAWCNSQVFEVVQRTLDHITNSLANNVAVELRNFGVFQPRLTKPRVGRNPNQPGSSFVIPPRATVKFKAGKIMRQRVEKLSRELKEAAEKRETAASRSNGQSEAAR